MSKKLTPKDSLESLNQSLTKFFSIEDRVELSSSFTNIQEHFNNIKNTIPRESLEALQAKIKEANLRIDRIQVSHQVTDNITKKGN